ncbi:hypothetical protein BXY85_3609 [Roseivirga pacifica]|uniref:Uncharacterized protein n=1 Tax=Roseivirga pacifica TaxID=1267423 RepID=A0A1I0QEZ6_9BACT|nr:hypothetical protein [Roseivirga pacifica]MCO6360767.1 hypothetical protein [Roseivirga pacifica]MCO6368656.1 hypothetical protein [Roseivirga pacifica]MCO6372799.1 hypothetical protein [Roseivirga pacifica]MCO6376858.1 hypothetical protein [Roseivirga pacifica]MCO6377864.1 hypothetical protein [Roseivirga pacifica]
MYSNNIKIGQYGRFFRDGLDLEDEYLDGIPVFIEQDWIFLKFVHDDLIIIDGYTLIRVSDLSNYILKPEKSEFRMNALELKGELNKFDHFDKETSWNGIVSYLKDNKSLGVFYTEEIDNTVCYVGQISEYDSLGFEILEISDEGVWLDRMSLSWKEVTRIDCFGGYDSALSLVASGKQ